MIQEKFDFFRREGRRVVISVDYGIRKRRESKPEVGDSNLNYILFVSHYIEKFQSWSCTFDPGPGQETNKLMLEPALCFVLFPSNRKGRRDYGSPFPTH